MWKIHQNDLCYWGSKFPSRWMWRVLRLRQCNSWARTVPRSDCSCRMCRAWWLSVPRTCRTYRQPGSQSSSSLERSVGCSASCSGVVSIKVEDLLQTFELGSVQDLSVGIQNLDILYSDGKYIDAHWNLLLYPCLFVYKPAVAPKMTWILSCVISCIVIESLRP